MSSKSLLDEISIKTAQLPCLNVRGNSRPELVSLLNTIGALKSPEGWTLTRAACKGTMMLAQSSKRGGIQRGSGGVFWAKHLALKVPCRVVVRVDVLSSPISIVEMLDS